MSCRLSAIISACAALLTVGLLPAAAQTPPPEKTITIDVDHADLHAVVGMLERQAGIEATIQDGSTPYQPVMVHLDNAPLGKAIRTVAFSAGAEVVRNSDGVYVFAPVGDMAADAPPQTQPRHREPINPKDLSYRKLFLQHITPESMLKLMHWDMPASNLPEGVDRIFALRSNNSLLLSATPDGFQKVRGIIKIVDLMPVEVQRRIEDADKSVIPALDDFVPTPNMRWYKIALTHTQAPDLVQEMRWSGPLATACLPDGVERVFAQHGENLLILHSIVDGFVEARSIVKILDTSGYTFAPTLTFLAVPKGDRHINWTDGPAQSLEVTTNDTDAQAFQELSQAGSATKTVKMTGWECIYAPIDLRITWPRLHGDGTLTLSFTYGNWDGFPVEVSGIHRGSVLAVRGKRNSPITLMRVDY